MFLCKSSITNQRSLDIAIKPGVNITCPYSMPVLHSKSPSSCITSILEPLHHTCHPWLCHALLPAPEHGDFAVIRTNLKFGNRAFRVTGPREWNSLPLSVRQCTSVAQFKSKLKIHLFSVYYDKECSIMHSRARLVFVKAQ